MAGIGQSPETQQSRYAGSIPPPAPRRSQQSTCLMVGGIGCLAVVVIVIVGAVVGYFSLKQLAQGLVENWTATEPVELPVVTVSEERVAELDARVDAFKEAIQHDDPAPPLVLSADDINALIQHNPGWEDLKGRLYVSLEGDLVRGEVSYPLDELGLAMVQGRYFNGSGSFDVFVRSGVLHVMVDSLEVGGRAAPDEIMEAVRTENFAADWNRNPTTAPMIRRLESVEVKDGFVTIVPRKLAPEAPSLEPETAVDTAPADAAGEVVPEPAVE